MQRDNREIMHKLSVLVLVSSLAISAALAAPQQVPQQQKSASAIPQTFGQSTKSSLQRNQQATTTTAAATSPTPADQSSAAVAVAPSASNAAGQSSSVPQSVFNNQAASSEANQASPAESTGVEASQPNEASELDLFDGKNPFTDASLWQIPLHLVRDISAAADAATGDNQQQSPDQMTNSASETSSLNDEDDDEQARESAPIHSPEAAPVAQLLSAAQQASGPEPATSIAAQTENSDLKTAAGYHYPTHGGHHAGHYDGHGYFQYVNVPKPKAWEANYKRGNSKHTIERYEKGYGPHFSTKVKWSDKHGHGVHTWEYNHDDHHSGHYDDHYDHHDDHHGGHNDYHHKKHQPKKHY